MENPLPTSPDYRNEDALNEFAEKLVNHLLDGGVVTIGVGSFRSVDILDAFNVYLEEHSEGGVFPEQVKALCTRKEPFHSVAREIAYFAVNQWLEEVNNDTVLLSFDEPVSLSELTSVAAKPVPETRKSFNAELLSYKEQCPVTIKEDGSGEVIIPDSALQEISFFIPDFPDDQTMLLLLKFLGVPCVSGFFVFEFDPAFHVYCDRDFETLTTRVRWRKKQNE